MFCNKCGRPLLSVDSKFCSYCGAPVIKPAAVGAASQSNGDTAPHRALTQELRRQFTVEELEKADRENLPLSSLLENAEPPSPRPADNTKEPPAENGGDISFAGQQSESALSDFETYDGQGEAYEQDGGEYEDEAYGNKVYGEREDEQAYAPYEEGEYEDEGIYEEDEPFGEDIVYDEGEYEESYDEDYGDDQEGDEPSFNVLIPQEAYEDPIYETYPDAPDPLTHRAARKTTYPTYQEPVKKSKKKWVIILCAAALILAAAGITAYLLFFSTSELNAITLSQSVKEIEAGDEVDLLTLVNMDTKDPGRFVLSLKENEFDYTALGTQDVTYIITDTKNGKDREITLPVIVVDTTPPVITCEPKIHVTYGDVFNILSYVHASDNADGALGADKITVSGYLNTQEEGTYPITVTATDSSGNVSTKDISVEVASTGTPDAFFDKITGYWYPSEASGRSSVENIYIFEKEGDGFFYKGISWQGEMYFDFINNDSTVAKGTIEMTEGGQTWTITFTIDTGVPADGKMDLTFNGTTFEVKHIGSSWTEAVGELGLTSFIFGGDTQTDATNGKENQSGASSNGNAAKPAD